MRNRSRAPLALAAALGLVASLAVAGIVAAAPTTLTAQLAGSADTAEGGSGAASVTLDPETGEACWELTVADIGPVMQSHIHVGAEGEEGDVVVPLDVDGFDGTSEGCVADQDAAALQAIIDNPAGYYVNLHTEEFPAGAIRGQLTAGTQPNTAVPSPDRSALALGLILIGVAGALGLRLMRPVEAREP